MPLPYSMICKSLGKQDPLWGARVVTALFWAGWLDLVKIDLRSVVRFPDPLPSASGSGNLTMRSDAWVITRKHNPKSFSCFCIFTVAAQVLTRRDDPQSELGLETTLPRSGEWLTTLPLWYLIKISFNLFINILLWLWLTTLPLWYLPNKVRVTWCMDGLILNFIREDFRKLYCKGWPLWFWKSKVCIWFGLNPINWDLFLIF